jgi:hypothetical protein
MVRSERIEMGAPKHVARVLLVALLLAAGTACAQPRYGLAPDAYAIFARWLTTTCVGDEAQALREALLRHRAELAPAFRRALADGPAPDMIAQVRAAADRRYVGAAQFPLQDYRIEGIAPESLARFARVPRQRYVDDEAQRFATGYRANAIAGLGIVGTAQDRAQLARLAHGTDALAAAAAAALGAMPPPR